METRPDSKNSEAARTSTSSFSDIIDAIQNLAKQNARSPLDNEEQIWLFLASWWSRTYNRPLKDPILQTYSTEELLYEFYDRIEREKASEESTEEESDKIEQAKEQIALDWAEQEEKRELEELAKKEAGKSVAEVDPTQDPNNQKWMQEQLREQKRLLGDDFGEDMDFSMGD